MSGNKSLLVITKEIDNVFALIEEHADPDTGEIIDLPGEVEEQLNQLTEQLSEKVDAVGFSMVMQAKSIEALQVMKKSIDAKIKTKKNSIDRFKKFLAPIVRKFGTWNKGNKNRQLVGPVVKIKDISKLDWELDLNANIDDKFKTVQLTYPYSFFKKNRDKLEEDQELLSVDFGVDVELLKLEYDTDFSNFNKVPILSENKFYLSKPKDKIKYPSIPGITKKWKDNVSFLGLKKLEVKQ